MLCLHFDCQGRHNFLKATCLLKQRDGSWKGWDYDQRRITMRPMATTYYCEQCTMELGENVWHDHDDAWTGS